jgi:hypothetical protein
MTDSISKLMTLKQAFLKKGKITEDELGVILTFTYLYRVPNTF